MSVAESILDVEVAHHCQIVCAVNLQCLKKIFKNVWDFAITTHAGIEQYTLIFGCDVILRVLYRISTFLPFQCANVTLENTSMVSLLNQ